jgi:hypothetical protein
MPVYAWTVLEEVGTWRRNPVVLELDRGGVNLYPGMRYSSHTLFLGLSFSLVT